MAFRRLPSLVYDRLPRAVRRVDRVHVGLILRSADPLIYWLFHVGLHSLYRIYLHSVLSAYDDHRQSRRKCR